jgi:hypothetical protein
VRHLQVLYSVLHLQDKYRVRLNNTVLLKKMPSYDDDYATCEKAGATLRIYHKSFPSAFVTTALNIEPSYSQESDPKELQSSGWFLTTLDYIPSRDVRRHLDFLLDQLHGHEDMLSKLRDEGWTMDVCCFWRSSTGQGGPTLSPSQMRRLSDFGLDCWFDIY